MSKKPKSSGNKLSRRSVLGLGAAGVGAGVFGLPKSLGGASSASKEAKNIVFCVVDGMAVSVMTLVDHYLQATQGRRSYWSWLMDQPYVVNGLQDTRSLSSVVTDSAAAAGAWGSGRRQWNGQINMFPDGTKLRTLYSLLREQGMRTGLVTTTTITHATPSGFAIQIEQRDKEADIAAQHLTAGVDVLLGGGDRWFSPNRRSDKRDLYAAFRGRGYTIVKTRSELMSAAGGKLLGVFSSSHMPYTVDRDNDPALQASVPTLADMSRVALKKLRGAPNGFALQIEGGRVDHGGHANDLAATFFDQIAFEDAVRVAVEFALEDGETLVIVTADHATGGPSLNGAGDEYFDSTAGMKTLKGMKSSYARLFDAYEKNKSRGGIRDATKQLLGVSLNEDEADAIIGAMNGASPFRTSEFLRSLNGTVATVLGNHTKLLWTSQNHTADHVLVTALGPGKEALAGMTWNTAMFDAMLATRGLAFQNPTMSYEEAKRHIKDDSRAAASVPDRDLEDLSLGELHAALC